MAIQVTEQVNAPNTYRSDASSEVVIVDYDTSERLAVISLPVQQMLMSSTDRMTWTIEVPVFSS